MSKNNKKPGTAGENVLIGILIAVASAGAIACFVLGGIAFFNERQTAERPAATQPAKTAPPSNASEPGQTQSGENAPSSSSHEITYQNVRVWTNNIGTTWIQAIVEVTNTGNENLYLGPGSYDLEDADGRLVKSQGQVSTYPSVLAPGEKGYMYNEITLDDYSGDGNLSILPRPDIKTAKVDLVRYGISDLNVSDTAYGGINVLGRIENTTDKAENGTIYIVAFFYDAAGTPIGSAFTILTETVDVGAKIGFEFSSFSMPNDITSEDIADTIIYAYPYQLQL